jgi:hypothetical protein
MSKGRVAFRCCLHLTAEEPGPGTYDVCPVCFWKSDIELGDSYSGGASKVSLSEARSNFKAFGAASKEQRHLVRSLRAEEIP